MRNVAINVSFVKGDKHGGHMIKKAYRIVLLSFIALLFHASFCDAENEYVIGDEDVLQISIWGNPELTITVPVRPDGMISAPLVGDVRATGYTPQKLKDLLEHELTKYIKSPTVSVIVTQVNSFKVFVVGEGISGISSTSPTGAITLKRNTTLLQLLSQIGSLQKADLHKAFILRNNQKLNIDFYKLFLKADVSNNIQLMPNDIIFIPDNFENRIMVIGEVRNPGVIPFREGMTCFDAILNTGGFTEFASPNDVVIIRRDRENVKKIEVQLKDVIKRGEINNDLPLEPGDRVIIKTGIF